MRLDSVFCFVQGINHVCKCVGFFFFGGWGCSPFVGAGMVHEIFMKALQPALFGRFSQSLFHCSNRYIRRKFLSSIVRIMISFQFEYAKYAVTIM